MKKAFCIIVGLISASEIYAAPIISVHHDKLQLSSVVTANFADGSSTSFEQHYTGQALNFAGSTTSTHVEQEHTAPAPDGDDYTAFAQASFSGDYFYEVMGKAEDIYDTGYSANHDALLTYDVDLEATACLKWIFDVSGGDAMASFWAVSTGATPGGKLSLFDMTTQQQILDLDTSIAGSSAYQLASDLLLQDGHTYKLLAMGQDLDIGDEEGYAGFYFSNAVVTVPEPGSVALLGLGLLALLRTRATGRRG